MSEKNLKNRKEEIESLVQKVQDGDQDAFAVLYDIFVDPLYRYVYYRVHKDEAEDIVETLFLKIWQNIKRYSKKPGSSFSSWAFRIAHNLVVDYYRAAEGKRTEELSDFLPDDSRDHNPLKNTERALDKEMLHEALDYIPEQYREILIYRFINELENKEIAKILGKTEGNLRILQFRALKSLRKQLEKMGIKPN
jgi:RNA polymerase sigma-70 factor, ECF subfamily